jgi:hypothetical protein
MEVNLEHSMRHLGVSRALYVTSNKRKAEVFRLSSSMGAC